MDISLAALGAAAVVFAATNVDDFVILAGFYGDPLVSRRAIVLGQFLGIGILTIVSACAALLALTVPPGWTSILGIVPLAMGVHKFAELRSDRAKAAIAEEQMAEEEKIIPGKMFKQILSISLVTIANGGDNLSVYIPLFANDRTIIPSYFASFMVLTGLWCLIGHSLVKNPIGVKVINRWGYIILPLVLVIIGVHILSGVRVLFQ